MQDITYVGEHAWAGTLGHTLAILSFLGALLSVIAYFLATRTDDQAWSRMGRVGFRVHTAAVFGVITVLFIMLFNHWFAYDYVWKHSNLTMPMRYILSCFWEGQEGSFLLWTFWHVVLGNILILRARQWEAPVMTVVALVQVFLATMLLGIHFGDVRVGSSPFLLIRELGENIGLPWTYLPNYLERIPQFADGRGLNPLLQNYWMTIHPPTLFLGFAATLVPFAYAIAGLWKGRLKEWIAPALPWTYFGIMVLGTGVLMGGAWAYEALSFGGFWAWDPVENASLVPWLTLVGAGHLMLVNKRKETSLFSTFMLTLVSFLLVLYSTFLTRSGVLGDTSVHSFTGEGMLPGLLLFMLSFVWLSVTLLQKESGQRRFFTLVTLALLVIGLALDVVVPAIIVFLVLSVAWTFVAQRGFPKNAEEEGLWTREFWLFIGALVLLLSAVQISFSTSIPVINLLLEPFKSPLAGLAESTGSDLLLDMSNAQMAPPADAIAHYNKWQVPFAFIITLLIAFVQYLHWKSTDMARFRRRIALAAGIALLGTVLGIVILGYRPEELDLIALLFSSIFAVVANTTYIWHGLKGKFKHAGSSIAHIGFGLVLLGALISTSRQDEVSANVQSMDLRFLNEEFNNSEDILLYKGDTVRMGEHYVRYREKEQKGVNLYFAMDYYAVEPRTYRAGDTVRTREALFRAKDDHVATEQFLVDQPAHWEELEQYPRRALWHAQHWSPTRPGELLFTLDPFVQLNPKFGNVAEPSTRHWLTHDLYTHIRYADLDDTDSSGYMPKRLYEKHLGDTIVTPTSIIVMDSLRTVRDSVTLSMLGPEYTVYMLRMRVRDLYDRERWFEARPIVIQLNGDPVVSKGFELPELRVRYELAHVRPGTDHTEIGLNVQEQEFVVMQAIVFPGINILWIGCVLLFLGTFMAIWQRVRRKDAAHGT